MTSGHGPGLIPHEAMDHTHPDHNWWVNGRGWCYDPDCPTHTYGRPDAPQADAGRQAPEETP